MSRQYSPIHGLALAGGSDLVVRTCFTDVEGQQIVLDRRQAMEEGPKILATYELPSDRSAEIEPRDYLRARHEEAVAQPARPVAH